MEMVATVFGFMAVLTLFYFGIRGPEKDRIAEAKFWSNQKSHEERARMK